MADFYVGDFGIDIALKLTQAGLDYDPGQDEVTYRFYKPNATIVDKTPAIGEVDGGYWATYTIEEGFLDVAGVWQIEVIVSRLGEHQVHGDMRFRVRKIR